MRWRLTITRLFFLSTACATFGYPQATPVLPPGLQIDIDAAFARHGVQARGATSPDFSDMLVRTLGPDNAALLQPALPYCLVITNIANSPITAVVMRYEGMDASGKLVDRGEQVQRIGNLDLSKPGRTLVFAPDPGVTTALISRTGIREAVARAASHLAAHSSTKMVILDSVVFADGAVVGRDSTGIIARERAKRAVEMDIMAKLEDSSVSDADLLQWLATFSPNAVPMDTKGFRDPVQMHRALLATRILPKVLKDLGRSGTAEWMKKGWANQTPQPSSLHKVE